MTDEEKKALTADYQALQAELARLEAEDAPKPSPMKQAGKVALGTLGGIGKVLDAPGGVTTRPLAALAMEALTGKDVYRPGEIGMAVDPRTLDTYPSSSELMERAGIPEGAKLSDYMGGFADPDPRNAWYKPEKGGRLDMTLRGAGGFGVDMALDPLNYISAGAAGAAKRAALEVAAKEVGKDLPKRLGARVAAKAGQAGQRAANALTMVPTVARDALRALPGGTPVMNQVEKVAQAPSRALQRTGKAIYDSGLLPVEHMGKRFGKSDVGETLYKHDIWGKAPTIAEEAGAVEKKLKSQLDTIKKTADDAGAQVDLTEAFGPFVNDLDEALTQGRITEKEAKALYEEFVGRYFGQPEPNASVGTLWKSDTYERIPKAPMGVSAFDVTKHSDLENRLGKTAGHGLKSAVETSVDRALGAGVGTTEMATKNDEWGKLLSTKNAMRQMSNSSEKKPVLTTADLLFLFGGGGIGGPKLGAGALAAKKLLDASRTTAARTGVGYATRKAAEGQLTGPMIDAFIRREFINKTEKKPDEENER